MENNITINKIKVENMLSSNGNKVPNQFEITTDEGVYFQSYKTIIAFKPYANSPVLLDRGRWDYSVTTSRYRNKFLDCDTKTVKERLNSGVYQLAELN
jgi:hypothetical protein